MRFRYGKHDWKTFERGEEYCYLMTNGLGGFSTLSLIGSCSRNDQAVLMACVHSPNNRYNMIHRLEEQLTVGSETYYISSQDFQLRKKRENGYLYQSSFTFEDFPVWTYLVNGVEIYRTIVLQQGKNTVGISYRIINRSGKQVSLSVKPHLQFVPKGVRLSVDQGFTIEACDSELFIIESNNQRLYLRTNGVCKKVKQRFCDTLYYSSDVEDGKMSLGRSAVNHEIYFTVEKDKDDTLELVYGMDEESTSVEEIIEEVKAYRQSLRETAGFSEELASQLAVSADQFISYRASTDGKTILAGFPFFEDWGRDTMISLPGITMVTGRFEECKSILRTFAKYIKKYSNKTNPPIDALNASHPSSLASNNTRWQVCPAA